MRRIVAIQIGLMLPAALANAGTNSSGGGGAFQAGFVEIGRRIQDCFDAHPAEATSILGIDAKLFGTAVDRVGVVCASGPTQAQMKHAGQEAYYRAELNTIYLSFCDETQRLNAWGPLVDWSVVAHEYFRSLGEGNEYRYSSRLMTVWNRYCRPDAP